MRLPPGERRVARGQTAAWNAATCSGASIEELRGDLGGGFAIAGEQIQQDGLVEHRRLPRRDRRDRRRRPRRARLSRRARRLVRPTAGSGAVGRPAQRASAAASSSGLIGLDR